MAEHLRCLHKVPGSMSNISSLRVRRRTSANPWLSNRPFYLKLQSDHQKDIKVVIGLISAAGLLFVIITHLTKPDAAILLEDEEVILSSCPQDDDGQEIVRERMTEMERSIRCNDSCNFQLVESVPCDMPFKSDRSLAKPLYQAWMELLNMTQESIHVASFYWSLTGEDLGINDTSSKQGEDVLNKFGSLLLKNVSLFIATHVPSQAHNSTDLEFLEAKGAHIKRIHFKRLTEGVLHSKFWIVDRKHVFLGSANMDWRAITQVKEVGIMISNCSCLANDLWKTFKTYWDLGGSSATIPSPWPRNYSTNINRDRPLEVRFNGTTTKAFFSASPLSFCPVGRTPDLQGILDVINSAEEFVYVSVMEYFPTSRFRRPPRYWPTIDNALRSVAIGHNVHIRLLVSCWVHSDPSMFHYLESLRSLSDPHANITIEVKIFIVPVGNHTNIPFARLSHSKYMVTEKAAYIGTSNWSEEYFSNTAGVGLIATQSPTDPQKKIPIIQEQLQSLFERDWNSRYSVNIDDLPGQKDCAWKHGFKHLKES
ncbi:5'-3' exonuclease PLD4 [Eublepharis macularius]|uniref:5'-3' exonuclease PLD4 n=1 Tax=Eublepharis macularius TaxID=481883 RepID=A0AA97IZ09_EUBMA|nr:5'-3' exonuclease PLD4 [Eublepharis macularius]